MNKRFMSSCFCFKTGPVLCRAYFLMPLKKPDLQGEAMRGDAGSRTWKGQLTMVLFTNLSRLRWIRLKNYIYSNLSLMSVCWKGDLKDCRSGLFQDFSVCSTAAMFLRRLRFPECSCIHKWSLNKCVSNRLVWPSLLPLSNISLSLHYRPSQI